MLPRAVFARRAVPAALLLVLAVGVVGWIRRRPPRTHSFPTLNGTQLSATELPTLPLLSAISSFSLFPASLVGPPAPSTFLNSSSDLHTIFASLFPISPTLSPLLTVGAIASHESEWIVEWLTWHRLAGVGRFVLLDIVPGGDKGGYRSEGDGRIKGLALRDLLRPWREEGSVVLVEFEWQGGKRVSGWQTRLLNVLETYLFPHVAWFAHWDLDEFLVPPSPSFPSSHLSPVSPIPSFDPITSHWDFPLHARLRDFAQAACVPVFRFPWENAGFEEFNTGTGGNGEWETITGTHVHRKKTRPEGDTEWVEYGKAFAHPDYKAGVARYGSPHACHPYQPDETPTMHPYTSEVISLYTGKGLANINPGMTLMHYYQRSLSNCFSKMAAIQKANISSWRTKSGATGCQHTFTPPEEVDEKLVRDERVKQSWQGRATRTILNGWWNGTAWKWLDGRAEDQEAMKGVVRIVL